jgi:hypothetical protein
MPAGEWSSVVIIRDLADPVAVFWAARTAAGATMLCREDNFGAFRMIRTIPSPGEVRVSVHFPAEGGFFGTDGGQPEGSLAVMFETSPPAEDTQAAHERIIGVFGGWLSGKGLHWEWKHQDGDWRVGG